LGAHFTNGTGLDQFFTHRLITISGAFQDARFVAEPVYVDPALEDEFQAGTVYLYVDAGIQDGSVGIDVQPTILGSVQGTCTRTDPNPSDSFEYLGKAICQFNYEFFDNAVLVASFSASGPVANGFSNILAITGGLGDLEGVSGEVYLEAATVDLTFSPAMAAADPSLDFLADADGYLMTAFLYTDPTRANLSR
jgi:hypothetical protein